LAESHERAWRIEAFDRRVHQRDAFDCGVEVLDRWLKQQASQYEKRGLARTYVLVTEQDRTVRGYYAIANHAVVFDALPPEQAKGLPQLDVPVVLLGRLAVDRGVQGQQLGELLLLDALRRAEYLAKKIGIRAVEVEAIDATAKRFYEKYGFIALADDPHHFFLPINTVRKLKLPPL